MSNIPCKSNGQMNEWTLADLATAIQRISEMLHFINFANLHSNAFGKFGKCEWIYLGNVRAVLLRNAVLDSARNFPLGR